MHWKGGLRRRHRGAGADDRAGRCKLLHGCNPRDFVEHRIDDDRPEVGPTSIRSSSCRRQPAWQRLQRSGRRNQAQSSSSAASRMRRAVCASRGRPAAGFSSSVVAMRFFIRAILPLSGLILFRQDPLDIIRYDTYRNGVNQHHAELFEKRKLGEQSCTPSPESLAMSAEKSRALLNAGHAVRAVIRDPAKARRGKHWVVTSRWRT